MKKTVKKSINSITVSEFKSWMSGVEDMQENGWAPNKAQWERIRAKINLLSDEIDIVDTIRSTEQNINSPNVPRSSFEPASTLLWGSSPNAPTSSYIPEPQMMTPTIGYMSGEKADFI